MNMNKIGLNQQSSIELSEKLNDLLANYQLFYMNTRGLHWNIKGEKFFELHAKFEELYNNLFLKIDEIAERVLTLGVTPYHSYTEFLKISVIKENINLTGAEESVKSVLDALEILLKKQRVLLSLSGNANDEGTSALMSDYIREQEKLIWMYSAFMAR